MGMLKNFLDFMFLMAQIHNLKKKIVFKGQN